MFYALFLLFPPHLVLGRLAWKDHVHQLVPLSDGSPHHYPWSSSDGSLSLSFQRRSKKQWILEPTNRRMNCFQAFLSLVLAFSFDWTLLYGPVLGSVLALAASDGQDALRAIYLLFIPWEWPLRFYCWHSI